MASLASLCVECPHAARCSGCPLIGETYAAQLAHKAELLAHALEPYRAYAFPAPTPVRRAAELTHYRGRAKLVVAPGARIGLYARGSHDVVDIPECRVMAPALTKTVAALRQLIANPAAESTDVIAALRAIDLREARGAQATCVLATLVLSAEHELENAKIRTFAEALMRKAPEVAGVAVSRRAEKSARVLGNVPETVIGAKQAIDSIGDVEHVATPGAFVQAHRGQAEALHREIVQGLRARLGKLENARVLDVFGGSGAIALALVKAGARVTLIESFAPAAEAARRMAGDRLEIAIADAAELPKLSEPPDAVIVNPPRRGLSPRARQAISELGARVLAYVSCNPETLARDLAFFRELGLASSELVPFDMIPLSDQVETLAFLEPAPEPEPVVLAENDELVAVDKPAHVPVTHLLRRLRRRTLSTLIPLDVGTSGVCLFGAHTGVQAETTFIALVRGVTRKKGVVNRENARTRYERIAVISGHSLLSVRPDAARCHPIRRHLAGIGHPVVGDERYGHAATNRHFVEKYGLDRTFLHLEEVVIPLSNGERPLLLRSSLAADLMAVRRRLEDPL